ncbi:hypothetical protein C8J38_1011479 [Rhizobium sp. PP-WC-2G-219]|nr:hypothetical protein C8J38_1011479 [Rhizobium sp. PP-WC-2G-219]
MAARPEFATFKAMKMKNPVLVAPGSFRLDVS